MDLVLLNAVSHLEKPDGVVAIPGPDGYVLASRLEHPQAFSRMHRMTGRQQDGLLLLGYDIDAFLPYVEPVPSEAFALMKRHWPGPLIVLLSKSVRLPDWVTPQATVKIMQPENPRIRDLLSLNPGGMLATSVASRHHEPCPRRAEDVLNTFGDDVDYVLWDDESIQESGVPTVVSLDTDGAVHLLRSGRIVLD